MSKPEQASALNFMQIWHLACLGIIPILYAVFRINSEPHDLWRHYLDDGTLAVGAVWAAAAILQAIVYGQQDGLKPILKTYRKWLFRLGFLGPTNVLLSVLTFVLLYQVLMYRQVEFIVHGDTVELCLNDTPDTPVTLGLIKNLEPIRFRLHIGDRHLVFRIPAAGDAVYSEMFPVRPVWMQTAPLIFKRNIREGRIDEVLH